MARPVSGQRVAARIRSPAGAGFTLSPLQPIILFLVLTVCRPGGALPDCSPPPLPYFRCPCPLILAHRGGAAFLPENTLGAFALARDQGADILELDVWMTRDRKIVVVHDRNLKRLTGHNLEVPSSTFTQLGKLRVRPPLNYSRELFQRYGRESFRIPRLSEVFDRFPEMRINIEIKQKEPPMERELWELIRSRRAGGRVLIASVDDGVLDRWRALAGPEIPISASFYRSIDFIKGWRLGSDYTPDVQALQFPHRRGWGTFWFDPADPDLLIYAHHRGLRVHYWTVNDRSQMERLLSRGADGLITDRPERALRLMNELGLRR